MYSVKEFCNMVGVQFSTLRYYERIGLLAPKKNSKNNYRMYDKHNVTTVNIFRYYRSLGIETEDACMLSKKTNQEHTVVDILQERRSKIANELLTLNRQLKALEHMETNFEQIGRAHIWIEKEEELFFLLCFTAQRGIEASFDMVSKWTSLLPIARYSRRIPKEALESISENKILPWEYGISILRRDSILLSEEELATAIRITGGNVIKFFTTEDSINLLHSEIMKEALAYIKQHNYKIVGDIYIQELPVHTEKENGLGKIVRIPIE